MQTHSCFGAQHCFVSRSGNVQWVRAGLRRFGCAQNWCTRFVAANAARASRQSQFVVRASRGSAAPGIQWVVSVARQRSRVRFCKSVRRNFVLPLFGHLRESRQGGGMYKFRSVLSHLSFRCPKVVSRLPLRTRPYSQQRGRVVACWPMLRKPHVGPNPSLNRTRNGMPPLGASFHSAPSGVLSLRAG